MLNKKIEYIKKNLLPEVLADTLEITHVAEHSEEYYNKDDDMAINSQIGFAATYKNQEVLINFFDGIGYRDSDKKTKVTVLKYIQENDIGVLDDGYYYWMSDASEVCEELHDLIHNFCFEETDETESLYDKDCEFVYNSFIELQAIEFIVVDEKIHRDITKRQSQIAAIQRLAKASQEASSGVLYQVFVICDNALERLYQNLTKDEAEALYVKLANEWYRYDDTFTNVDEIEEYENSEEYENNGDVSNVTMEIM